MKWTFLKKLIATAMVVSMTFSGALHVAAFVDGFAVNEISLTSPVALKENGWGLSSDTVYLLDLSSSNNNTSPNMSFVGQPIVSQPLSAITTFHPGDKLLIPVVRGTYDMDGIFTPSNTTGLEFYNTLGVPSNWAIPQTNPLPSFIKDVTWYQGNESGIANTLFIMVQFVECFEDTNTLPFNLTVYMQDSDTGSTSNVIDLAGTFENRCSDIVTGFPNIVSSPMVFKTPVDYDGTPVTFSFGDGILLQDVVMAPEQCVYFNLDTTFDNDFANQYLQFDLQFYQFCGDLDRFQQPGVLTLPAGREEPYVYEIINGVPNKIQAQYDEENEKVTFLTSSLGYYVVSSVELRVNQ